MSGKDHPRTADVEVIDAKPARVGNSLEPAVAHEVLDKSSEGLTRVLSAIGLPTEGVLVPVEERWALFQNLGAVIDKLPAKQRGDANYLSKFVAASAVGLFDASLNYVWNETVRALRGRVANFDLEYFFESIPVSSKARDGWKSEEDLKRLEDWHLITGCKNCGIISELAYLHLDHIREMRNYASAAHPNQTELTGLNLAAWLDTCIREVLAKPIEAGAVQNRQLLQNLRKRKLKAEDAVPINQSIEELPVPYANSLLLAACGLYTDPDTTTEVRANVELIAKAAWDRADDTARNEIGCSRYTRYSNNGETERAANTRKFIQVVDGKRYLSEEMKVLEIQELTANLWSAHTGYNNFHAEPAHAKALASLVSNYGGKLPSQVVAEYVRVVIRCKLTNGHGTAWGADEFYDTMIEAFGPREIVEFARLTSSKDFKDRFKSAYFGNGYLAIAKSILGRSKDPATENLMSALTKSTLSELAIGRSWINVEPLTKYVR